jgi:hypothetical protein
MYLNKVKTILIYNIDISIYISDQSHASRTMPKKPVLLLVRR